MTRKHEGLSYVSNRDDDFNSAEIVAAIKAGYNVRASIPTGGWIEAHADMATEYDDNSWFFSVM